MNTYRKSFQKVTIKNGDLFDVFQPHMIEKCMEPGKYNTYPVEIREQGDTIIVNDLNSKKTYPLTVEIQEDTIEIEQPGRSRCDGNCDNCGKCS